MPNETWIEPKSHYQATGSVSNGRMTNAEVTDNNGLLKDRNRTFDSKEDFYRWAKKSAGINW
ncbi:hypothetical protein [Nocardia altamirensis]|uniref:hypothetical protein n=1 Tax=Nocardia altamirensis TaxID=472158 RepID=UPI00114CBD99|nr:hypothetical protein [Nocardia altamirensis]